MLAATLGIKGGDKATRLAAIKLLGASSNPSTKTLLLPLADKAEADAEVRMAAQESLKTVEARLARANFAGLAVLRREPGIDPAARRARARDHLRAHGRHQHGARRAHHDRRVHHLRGAEPVPRVRCPAPSTGTCCSRCRPPSPSPALVGMALERSVIRWLYGRPLETLLATWGISLMLIQGVRTIFGAQNVQVENPAFMSGGVEIFTGIVMPWSRIVIIAFAAAVLGADRAAPHAHAPRASSCAASRRTARWRRAWACRPRASTCGPSASAPASRASPAARSRRSATSGPTWARPTSSIRSWSWCWAAWASSPGTVYAALGLGFANKLLENWQGAVIAKIVVLVFIIVVHPEAARRDCSRSRAGRWRA